MRGRKPQGKIKITWSSNFAYAIGLLVTDGYLSKDCRHVTLISKDKVQLQNFIKCLDLYQIKIPDHYFFDFLRGCLDGDGCSYSYWDPRWKSSYMFYIAFTSGSRKFVDWLQSSVARLSNLNGHITINKKSKSRNVFYQLKYAKYESIKLAKLLYYHKRVIKLNRKYLKIQRSLGIVRTHKGRVFVR